MRAMVTVYEHNGWILRSQGNGAFYELRSGRYSVYFQGDDANQFREEVMDTDGFLRSNCEERFSDYASVMYEDDDQ